LQDFVTQDRKREKTAVAANTMKASVDMTEVRASLCETG